MDDEEEEQTFQNKKKHGKVSNGKYLLAEALCTIYCIWHFLDWMSIERESESESEMGCEFAGH